MFNRSKPFPVKLFVTHHRPDLDEIAARWDIINFGQDLFPGAVDAPIEFLGAGGENLLEEKDAIEESDGILGLGVGGGPFDEHPGPGKPGRLGQCCNDLVVEYLGISKDPKLAAIIEFVHKTDLTAAGHKLDLACMTKTMHFAHQTNPLLVVNWATDALDTKYQEVIQGVRKPTPRKKLAELAPTLLNGLNCSTAHEAAVGWLKNMADDNSPFGLRHITAVKEALSNHETAVEWVRPAILAAYAKQLDFCQAKEVVVRQTHKERIYRPRGSAIMLYVAKTDCEQFSSAARADGAGLIIQQNSTGHIKIYTNQKFNVNLDDIAAELRQAEQRAKGVPVTHDRVELTREGKIEGAEEWYYFRTGSMLLNGSLKVRDTPKTKLNLPTVVDISKAHVG